VGREQMRQRVDDHYGDAIALVQDGDGLQQGQPLVPAGLADERAAQAIDVAADAELPEACPPFEVALFGNHQSLARGHGQARQLAAFFHAGKELGHQGRFARFTLAGQQRDLAQTEVTRSQPRRRGITLLVRVAGGYHAAQ